jgi:hypothetical protein
VWARFWGELLHVDMFAHNKSGIAYRDRSRRSETAVDHKREPTSSEAATKFCAGSVKAAKLSRQQ